METIKLNGRYLKAALVCAGVKDVRFYLNGVFVEVMPRETRVISTDGARAVVFRAVLEKDEPDQAVAEILIPNAIIKALKVDKRIPACELSYVGANPSSATLSHDGAAVTFTPIDGKYPDYRRIFPTQPGSGMQAHFQLQYLADITHAVQIAFDNNRINAEVWHDGPNNVALVTCGHPEFCGVVMPMRGSSSPSDTGWIRELPPVKLKIAA